MNENFVYTEYITQIGDRWDLIAYKCYGTIGILTLPDGTIMNAMSLLIEENPDISITDVLPPGLLLQVPIIADPTTQLGSSLLPPWATTPTVTS
jgi:hypothetical protein